MAQQSGKRTGKLNENPLDAALKPLFPNDDVRKKTVDTLTAMGVTSLDDLHYLNTDKLEAQGISPVAAGKIMTLDPHAAKGSSASADDDDTSSDKGKGKGKAKSEKEDDSPNNIASQLGIDPSTMMLLLAGGGGSLADLVDPVALISAYNPRKQGHPITRILKNHYNGKSVIAYRPGHTSCRRHRSGGVPARAGRWLPRAPVPRS
jgi:hypothetical protein